MGEFCKNVDSECVWYFFVFIEETVYMGIGSNVELFSFERKKKDSENQEHQEEYEVTRRDFLSLTTSGMAAVGGGAIGWTLVQTMNPGADVLENSKSRIAIEHVALGQTIIGKWRGKPIFIRHRTPEDISKERAVKWESLKHPEPDQARVKKGKEQWLVVIGSCTHLGCIPLDRQGEYGGWLCPCHGSIYDGAGRIRKGPAPTNMDVPPYKFVNGDKEIEIG